MEISPEAQILQSNTPAVIKKAQEAAAIAKQQAEQQAQMMRQVLTMFSPAMQGEQGKQSLGKMMQPASGAAGQAPKKGLDEGLSHERFQTNDPMERSPAVAQPQPRKTQNV